MGHALRAHVVPMPAWCSLAEDRLCLPWCSCRLSVGNALLTATQEREGTCMSSGLDVLLPQNC